MQRSWRRNLRLFVTYRAGISLIFNASVSLPFLMSLGFSVGEFAELYAILGLVMALCDIPTGFIADRIGYRRMLLVGVLVQGACYCTMSTAHTKWLVWLLWVLNAGGQATTNSADTALARRSADLVGADFALYSRRGVACMGVGEASASVVTAIVAFFTPGSAPRISLALQGVVFLALTYVPWRMVEPPHPDRVPGSAATLGDYLRDLYRTVRNELRTNREARWLILYAATIGCTTSTVVPLVQPYFISLHLQIWAFALLGAGYSYLWSVFALLAGRYEAWFGRWHALASLVAWGILTNLAMIVLPGPLGLVCMTAFYFVRGVQMPIVQDYMTGVLNPGRVATLLSVKSTIQYGVFSLMTPILGYVMQHSSVHTAFAVSLGVYGMFGLTFIGLLRAAAPHEHRE